MGCASSVRQNKLVRGTQEVETWASWEVKCPEEELAKSLPPPPMKEHTRIRKKMKGIAFEGLCVKIETVGVDVECESADVFNAVIRIGWVPTYKPAKPLRIINEPGTMGGLLYQEQNEKSFLKWQVGESWPIPTGTPLLKIEMDIGKATLETTVTAHEIFMALYNRATRWEHILSGLRFGEITKEAEIPKSVDIIGPRPSITIRALIQGLQKLDFLLEPAILEQQHKLIGAKKLREKRKREEEEEEKRQRDESERIRNELKSRDKKRQTVLSRVREKLRSIDSVQKLGILHAIFGEWMYTGSEKKVPFLEDSEAKLIVLRPLNNEFLSTLQLVKALLPADTEEKQAQLKQHWSLLHAWNRKCSLRDSIEPFKKVLELFLNDFKDDGLFLQMARECNPCDGPVYDYLDSFIYTKKEEADMQWALDMKSFEGAVERIGIFKSVLGRCAKHWKSEHTRDMKSAIDFCSVAVEGVEVALRHTRARSAEREDAERVKEALWQALTEFIVDVYTWSDDDETKTVNGIMQCRKSQLLVEGIGRNSDRIRMRGRDLQCLKDSYAQTEGKWYFKGAKAWRCKWNIS
uniref:Uncharacterized protein n=1 Tax=Lotharella oceanica TaxID=641309 RepID=A0A7S2XA96_9EUKA